ncbi:MAG TPA: NO-inducible flavohemoprotein [Marinobacter sp.]|uniref:nitric oxide dioxygenase n=2 Tax=root TaxID=1 RepID=A0A0F9U2A7_9ZZZZ|nr:NO-inducible flavohemoprotein [Marinobacter sp.]
MLSEHTIATVKSTVPLLAENGQAITQEFYKKLFANNPDLQHIFNMANQRGGSGSGQSSALADAVFAYANNIDQIEVLVPAVQRIASKHASIGIQPKHYPIVGENLIAAIQDVLQLPDNHEALIAWGEAYGVLAQIFTDTEERMYSEKEMQSGGWRGFRPFTIDRIVEETPEVKSFYFKPSDGGAICGYSGGQYLGIKLAGTGDRYDEIRQYSLSSWGAEDYYRISVKAETHGAASQQLHQCAVGDVVELSAPNGQFLLNKNAPKHVFISGGVGITPLYSMLKEALASGIAADNIQFVECSRSAEHQIFRTELAELKASTGLNLRLAFEFGEGADWVGYLSADILDQWLTDKSAHIYFCGPMPFMAALKSILNSIGFPDDQLHYEVFGPTTALPATH